MWRSLGSSGNRICCMKIHPKSPEGGITQVVLNAVLFLSYKWKQTINIIY